MQILNTNGTVYLLSSTGEKVEVSNVSFAEFYDPEGYTPQQLQVNIINPRYSTTDSFFFLKERTGIIYNSIQTSENAMELLELYMSLIPKKELTPPLFISELLKKYFISIEGYRLT